jgi:hypothetical protein
MLMSVTDAKKLVCNKHSQHPWGLEDEARDNLACVLVVTILSVLPVAS